jgi:hypothetical protein
VYAAEVSLSLSLCCALIAISGTAIGQTLPLIGGAAELKATMTDETRWMYFPGVSGQSTVGFLASIDPSVAPRGSFTVVWFQRVAPGSFTMEGWTETSIEDAAAVIETRFNDPDLFQYADLASSPMSVTQQGQGMLALPPEGTINGIADGDPWRSVAGTLTAEDVGFLVDNGFAVGARNLSEGGEMIGPCSDEFDAMSIRASQLAAAFEATTFGQVSPASTLPSSIACCSVSLSSTAVAAFWCSSTKVFASWSPGQPITKGGAPACRWVGSGSIVTVCGSWCFGPPYTTTLTPFTENRTCPTTTPGVCPATPTCAGLP